MRALATSAVLSSLVLGGCLSAATAQSVGAGAPGTLNLAQDEQASGGDVAVGVIPQPSMESPGMVMGVTVGELFTDNLTLAASGTPKKSSWITQVQPFFKWAHSSPRFSGVLDYRLSGYLYSGGSSSNQLAQDLKAHGIFTVIPQHVFVDGSLSYGQQVINNELPSGSGTFFLDNNRANVTTGSISPYWIQDLGKIGSMMLRYTLGRVMYDDHGISSQNPNLLNGLSDSTINGLQFNLASPQYQTWGWNLGYSDQHIKPDVGRSFDYAVAKLGTSWQVTNRTKLLADVGKESQFLADGTTRKLGASFWDVGFDWSDSRDHVKLLVGHRFYGRSYDFSWSRSAARLTTAVTYLEQPTDLNQQLLGQDPSQALAAPVGVSNLPSLRQRQVYLMRRGSASANYEMPKGHLQVTLYDERRTYFTLDNGRERVANVNVDWLYNLGPFTTLTPTLGWQRYKFLDGQIRYNRYAQVALVHQLNPKNFASLRVRHDSSDVNYDNSFSPVSPYAGGHGYGVNVIFLQLTHLF